MKVLRISGLFALTIFVGCSSPEPVATQYKNSKGGGAAVGTTSGGTGGGSTGGSTGGGDATAGRDETLAATGVAFFNTNSCNACHPGAAPPLLESQATGLYPIDLIDEAGSLPAHGQYNPWPSGNDAEALAHAFTAP